MEEDVKIKGHKKQPAKKTTAKVASARKKQNISETDAGKAHAIKPQQQQHARTIHTTPSRNGTTQEAMSPAMLKFYANPRFQASPAPDALPIPTKFMSRSLPKAEPPMFHTPTTNSDPNGNNHISPLVTNPVYQRTDLSPPASSQGTLLAKLFQADQEQKSGAIRASGLTSQYDGHLTSPTRSQIHLTDQTSPQLHMIRSQPNLASRHSDPSLPPPPDPNTSPVRDKRTQLPIVDSKHIPPSVFARQQHKLREPVQAENINQTTPTTPNPRSNLEHELRKSLRLV